MIPSPIHAIKPLGFFQVGHNSRPVINDESLQELSRSILANGLLQPLISLDDGLVLAGHRRLAAMELADLPEAPALIYPSTLTITEQRTITATENMQRLDLTPPQTYGLCKELFELNPTWQLCDLAAHLSKSPGTITKYMAAAKLEPEPLAAFMAGEFGFDTAYSITKSPNQSETLRIIRGGGNREAVRRAAKPKADAVRSEKLVIPLPSGLTVKITGAEVSLEEGMDAALEAAKLAKVAIAKNLNVRTAQAYWKDVATN